jgi:hypothetical protein
MLASVRANSIGPNDGSDVSTAPSAVPVTAFPTSRPRSPSGCAGGHTTGRSPTGGDCRTVSGMPGRLPLGGSWADVAEKGRAGGSAHQGLLVRYLTRPDHCRGTAERRGHKQLVEGVEAVIWFPRRNRRQPRSNRLWVSATSGNFRRASASMKS